MKKLLLAGMLLFNLVIFAQATKDAAYSATEAIRTTDEEYNYLTKGLKLQLDSGLDTKKGYRLDAVYSREFNKFSFVVSNLVLVESSDLKAISVKIYSPITSQTYYICIPVNNPELTAKHFQNISLFTQPLAQAYGTAMGDYLTMISTKFMNYHKSVVKQQ